MKAIHLAVAALACVGAAHADFSYTQTRKGGPSVPGAAPEQPTKHYLKGQKMKTESGATASILDFDAQTITRINHQTKSYTVTKFSDLGETLKDSKVDATIDVKETGQKKNINGFNAIEVVMNMSMETPESRGMKMNMEMDMWLSPDPPGAGEIRAFYQRNRDHFPWAALAGGGANPGMAKAMADMQKKVASLGGVAVLQVVKMKSAGANDAQTAQMNQGMAQARAQMEAMAKQGGPQAQAAQQALARMAAMSGGGGSLFEITMESSDFSTSRIPDSTFEIPAGYQKR